MVVALAYFLVLIVNRLIFADKHWHLNQSLHPDALPRIESLEAPKEVRKEEAEPTYEAPVFITHLNNIECKEGDTVHFECHVEPAKDPTLGIGTFLIQTSVESLILDMKLACHFVVLVCNRTSLIGRMVRQRQTFDYWRTLQVDLRLRLCILGHHGSISRRCRHLHLQSHQQVRTGIHVWIPPLHKCVVSYNEKLPRFMSPVNLRGWIFHLACSTFSRQAESKNLT